MDSLTHIVLGACIGEAVAGNHLGKRAMLVGALAQSIPDIDFITHFWLDKTDDIIAHRGFTHSILFGILATFVMAWATKRYFYKRQLSWKESLLLFGFNIFAHLFLDSLNAYGIGWFEPFSDYRVSFHVLFVADPFFSVAPFLAVVILLFWYRKVKLRKIAWISGIVLSMLYLGYAYTNKMTVTKKFKRDLAAKGITPAGYFTTPTPFNSWLWYVVARDTNGYYIGYRSTFDRHPTELHFYPRNDSLLDRVKDRDEVNDLVNFSQEYYTVQNWNDTIVFNVLRFGQVVGWYDPAERFAFYYFMDQEQAANELVVQRGRFERWNDTTFNAFIRRIQGKQLTTKN